MIREGFLFWSLIILIITGTVLLAWWLDFNLPDTSPYKKETP